MSHNAISWCSYRDYVMPILVLMFRDLDTLFIIFYLFLAVYCLIYIITCIIFIIVVLYVLIDKVDFEDCFLIIIFVHIYSSILMHIGHVCYY